MPATTSDHIAVTLRSGGKTVSLPPSTFSFTIPNAFVAEGTNREVVQLKDGNDNWELIYTGQRNDEFTLEPHADGVLYEAAAENWWACIQRAGLYAADAFIDAGGMVFTTRMDVAITRDGVTRTLVMPSVYIRADLSIDPGGNKTPCNCMITGPTDPYWT